VQEAEAATAAALQEKAACVAEQAQQKLGAAAEQALRAEAEQALAGAKEAAAAAKEGYLAAVAAKEAAVAAAERADKATADLRQELETAIATEVRGGPLAPPFSLHTVLLKVDIYNDAPRCEGGPCYRSVPSLPCRRHRDSRYIID
jgi:hypothetical protein